MSEITLWKVTVLMFIHASDTSAFLVWQDSIHFDLVVVIYCFRFSLVLVDESFKRFSLLNLLTCNMGMHCSNTEDIGPWTTRTSLFNLVLTQLTHSVKHAFIQCIQLMKHSDTARTRTQLAHACSKIVAALCPSSEPQWMRNIIFKKGITFLQSYKHVTYLVHSLACHSLF